MARNVSVLVCDEVLFNLGGKAFLQGVYTGDILIAADPSTVPQLVFYFTVDTELSEPFTTLTAEISLPEAVPTRISIPIFPFPMQPLPGRTKRIIRWPVVVPFPVLRAGRISIKIIHEAGELPVNGPWIVCNPQQQSEVAN